ncbi:hypothetical protein MMC07_009809 [Pseudocyphellaria aurata]|nr:hypothetical protein [Pseudocyphellaria aurata]
MESTITIRPCQVIPQHLLHRSTISAGRWITFLHPAYPEDYNSLLKLQAPDHPSGGIHHETARIACAIIAGNRWDGYFTETVDGPRVETPPHGVLQKSDYFFHVPSSALDPGASGSEVFQYPIVPCFEEWKFPHNNLPSSWIDESPITSDHSNAVYQSNLALAVRHRDVSCRMSDHQETTELAHLCPRSEAQWFFKNKMRNYVRGQRKIGITAVDDPSNVILLREDLHTAFDRLKFVFVPKSEANGDSTLVTHVLAESSELCRLYQNAQLHSMNEIPREFLLARFAWSIFQLFDGFLEVDIPRALLTSTGHRTVSSEECRLYTKQGKRSRSESPKKRSRPDSMDSIQEADLTEDEFTESPRGRKRRRRNSSYSPPDTASVSTPASTTSAGLLQLRSVDDGNEDSPKSRISLMKQQFLESERSKSDPEGSWTKELAWVGKAFDDGPISGKDILRYYAAYGYDVTDEVDDFPEGLGEKTSS